jgi:hypothetical protein
MTDDELLMLPLDELARASEAMRLQVCHPFTVFFALVWFSVIG